MVDEWNGDFVIRLARDSFLTAAYCRTDVETFLRGSLAVLQEDRKPFVPSEFMVEAVPRQLRPSSDNAEKIVGGLHAFKH